MEKALGEEVLRACVPEASVLRATLLEDTTDNSGPFEVDCDADSNPSLD